MLWGHLKAPVEGRGSGVHTGRRPLRRSGAPRRRLAPARKRCAAQVTPEGRKTVIASGVSDERGTLVLRIKPFEDYEIRASREGFVPALEPPTIWPVVGETAVNILLAPGEPVPALPDGDSTAGRTDEHIIDIHGIRGG